MNEFTIELGSEVKDKLSVFKGIVRGRTQYMTGCNIYGVQTQKLKDDRPAKMVWFDEIQLKVLKSKKINFGSVKISKKRIYPKGGPLSEDQFPPS